MFRFISIIFIFGFASHALAEDLKVATVLEAPWIIMNKESKYEGFVVDLLAAISDRSSKDYNYTFMPDPDYGYLNMDGKWSGAIGQLVDGKANIAAAPFKVTDKRKAVVDFTKPILSEGYKVLIKKPDPPHSPGLKLLFEPFSAGIWGLILVICIVVGVFLFLIDKFSPSEWSKVPAEDDPTNARTSFILPNALFFVHSTITWQGYKEAPRSPAGRILTSMWFSFIFFMILAYTANLTAFLIARDPSKPVVPFKTFRQMEFQSEVEYGAVGNGVLVEMFKESDDPLFKRMSNIVTQKYTNNADLVNAVKSSSGNFAAILPSLIVEKETADNCDVMAVGETIFIGSLAFACSKGSSVCPDMSTQLLKLQEDGTMQSLQKKWWSTGGCPEVNLGDYFSRPEITLYTASPLMIADVSIALIVLLIGFVFGALLLVLEVFLHKRRSQKANLNDSEQPVVMTTNGGKSASAEEGKDEEKAPMTVDEA